MPRRKDPKATRSEKEVTEQVVEAARALGIELRRRNVGGFYNPSGRYVAFGEPGDADRYAQLAGGRLLEVEIKEESFDPAKLTGEKREHFERQLAQLRKTNKSGGVGMWVRSSTDFIQAMMKIVRGWSVAIDDDGYCWLVSPDEPTESAP